MNQLEDDIKSAVLGNTETIISFRIGTEDAMYMAKEMYPEFDLRRFYKLSKLPYLFKTDD